MQMSPEAEHKPSQLLSGLVGEGGLLRVRAVLSLGLTVIGGWYLLLHQTMPPGEFNVMWASSIIFYFATRANKP